MTDLADRKDQLGTTGGQGRPAPRLGAPRRRRVLVAVAIGLGIIGLSVVWGRRLQERAPEVLLGAAPFVGRNLADGWDWRFGWGLVGAAAIAAIVTVGVLTGWWWRARRWVVVAASGVGAGAFATMLALTDGADGLLNGAAHRTEYLSNVSGSPPAAEFLRTFVDRIGDYSVHQRGHPPGFVLLLKAMDAIGLHGPWPVVALSIGATVVLPVAVLVTVAATAGSDWMRRAAPLLVVAPYALWVVTSADAFYAAFAACGVALLAVGLRRTGARALALGASAGVVLGGLLYLTYGGATFALLPLSMVVVAARRDRRAVARTVAATIVGTLAVVAAFTTLGFWWFAGAAAARVEYWEGTAQFRPWTYFSVSNAAVALVAVGPATWAGLATGGLGRLRVLVVGAGLALLAAYRVAVLQGRGRADLGPLLPVGRARRRGGGRRHGPPSRRVLGRRPGARGHRAPGGARVQVVTTVSRSAVGGRSMPAAGRGRTRPSPPRSGPWP